MVATMMCEVLDVGSGALGDATPWERDAGRGSPPARNKRKRDGPRDGLLVVNEGDDLVGKGVVEGIGPSRPLGISISTGVVSR